MQRNTQQRRAIREAFAQLARPLTPLEVLEAAGPGAPGLGIATVYRNLKALVDEGWLKPVELPGQSPRYERANIGHHHHFHCRSCGKVFDIAGCPGELKRLVPAGFKVEDHEFVLYGKCPGCARV